MIKKIVSQLYLKLAGWKIHPSIPEEAQGNCVLIAAPHTTNWDYPLTMAAMAQLGVPIKYTIKDDYMRPPFGWFFKMMGGIGINRKPKKEGEERPSMVDVIANLFEGQERLCIIMEPEGTRSKVVKWKTGFYYVALKAKVPILLGWLDYAKKEGGIGKVIHPSGDIAKDMAEIMCFYKDILGKNPELFALDETYYQPDRCS
ncbi:1-acyl-sn-glycerol-3-phosphate acyltransferase [Saprospira sp. CCB-QB6]|uniref:1-acyl-sn-glycerol-3-phosphate acyltransferase n=1 Tax=Saprospira sp. CCB-QB6 TaxID=3023936 RepID=UPI00234A2A97|nr:1-acyl-sn-glycerol-3-phosphate acyltransferase [Saprospira sp. CCB-QB6]WCL82187.1 1-acyl-sn-glycerol-3-phosphate acyltransferase [Saprospira sp. CCB-QB6]